MKRFNLTIVGGGSTWTPGLLMSLCKMKERFPVKKLVLFDINAERQAQIGEYAKVLFKEEYPDIEFCYTTKTEEAYTDVDFVFVQIRTGGFKMRERDEMIPLSLGLLGQETCGPGGFAYGLRSIGDMIKVVEDIRKYSKEAWVLNYTNPAAIVAEALQRVFPLDKRILNICDQPVNLMRSYGRILGMKPNEYEPVYFGLNHFGWFTNLYDKRGNDLIPKLRDIIIETGFAPVDAEQRDPSWLQAYSTVREMVMDFPEYLPSTYLQYYLYPDKIVQKLDPNYTRASEVMDGREKRVFDACRRISEAGTVKGFDIVHNDAHSEYIIELAESLAFNKPQIFIVILENNGIISNIQSNAMVEVAARVSSRGVQPFAVGEIPTFYKGMMEGQLAYEKLTVDAYMEGSYQKALQALTLNRTVVSANKARAVLDALIEANKEYWPELK